MSQSLEELQLINQVVSKGLNYDDSREGVIVIYFEGGDNLDEIPCYATVRTLDSGSVIASVSCYEFPSFKNDIGGYIACNKANDDALVARFYIDEDDDAVAHFCSVYEFGFDPRHFMSQLEYFANDMDDAYPFFREAKR